MFVTSEVQGPRTSAGWLTVVGMHAAVRSEPRSRSAVAGHGFRCGDRDRVRADRCLRRGSGLAAPAPAASAAGAPRRRRGHGFPDRGASLGAHGARPGNPSARRGGPTARRGSRCPCPTGPPRRRPRSGSPRRRWNRWVRAWSAAGAWRSPRPASPTRSPGCRVSVWLVERYVLVGGLRVPFVVLGETGVFALWGLDQTPRWADLPVVNRAAAAVQALLPDYPGQVHVGLCRAFDPVNPRWWYASESGCGAWLLGVNWLERWLAHFDDGAGLADGDVARAAALARPRWRPRTGGLAAEHAEHRLMGVGARARRSAAVACSGGATACSASVERGSGAPAGWCRACWEGEVMCPSCVGRRTWAFGQVEKKGRSVAEVAVDLQRAAGARGVSGRAGARPPRVARMFKKRPLLADARWFIDVRARARPGADPRGDRAADEARDAPGGLRSRLRLCGGGAVARSGFISVEMGTPADARARPRPARARRLLSAPPACDDRVRDRRTKSSISRARRAVARPVLRAARVGARRRPPTTQEERSCRSPIASSAPPPWWRARC